MASIWLLRRLRLLLTLVTAFTVVSAMTAVGVVLVIAFIIYWVKVRDRVHQRIRAFMDEGRSYTAQQRSSA